MSRVFMAIYGCAIALLVATLVWSAFDIHERLPILLGVQCIVLLLRAVWRFKRPGRLVQ